MREGMISKVEFSRMAKVTKAAVSIALSRGRITPERDGSMNPKRKENASYITDVKRQRRAGPKTGKKDGAKSSQHAVRVKRGRKKQRDPDDEDSELGAPAEPLRIDGESYGEAELRKIIAQADKEEQQNAIRRGELVERTDVHRIFSRLYQIHTSQLKTLADKLGPDMAAALGAKDADTLRVQELMDLEVRRALAQMKKEMNAYLDDIGDGTVSE